MATEPYIPQQDEDEIDSLSDLLDIFERAVKGDIDTAFVGQVQTYDASTQTCSVKPVIQARFLNGDALDLPVVPRVPVCFPRGGGFMMTWPLEAGDTVLVVCADRSIDEWKATNNSSILPVDLRRFDLSDAVAYAGVSSPAAPLLSATDDSMVIGEDSFSGMKITIKDGKVSIGTTAAELLNLVDNLIGALDDFTTATSAAAIEPTLGPASVALKGALLPISTLLGQIKDP
jgi:hypothetical protein